YLEPAISEILRRLDFTITAIVRTAMVSPLARRADYTFRRSSSRDAQVFDRLLRLVCRLGERRRARQQRQLQPREEESSFTMAQRSRTTWRSRRAARTRMRRGRC